jgi:hypothetical protein
LTGARSFLKNNEGLEAKVILALSKEKIGYVKQRLLSPWESRHTPEIHQTDKAGGVVGKTGKTEGVY